MSTCRNTLVREERQKNRPSDGRTHRNLCENVKEEGDDGEVEVDPGSSKALAQVLGHGDHLKAAH